MDVFFTSGLSPAHSSTAAVGTACMMGLPSGAFIWTGIARRVSLSKQNRIFQKLIQQPRLCSVWDNLGVKMNTHPSSLTYFSGSQKPMSAAANSENGNKGLCIFEWKKGLCRVALCTFCWEGQIFGRTRTQASQFIFNAFLQFGDVLWSRRRLVVHEDKIVISLHLPFLHRYRR